MKKVLVANRSEIACRVFQAARERGYACVALCAPGDEDARHVTFADEVLHVPSYLDVEAIVAAAKAAHVWAIHPGYGFLSERPVFARAVEKAGIVFLGPTAETMEATGDKIASKELAERAKVPTLPWAKVKAGTDLGPIAKKIGFPLLIKASAGGGGKGMRRVDRAEDLNEAAESAVAEVKAAFGDPTIFLERMVDRGRHIEVQVFGDGTGKGLALFERECSLQRRHQKVWEEAPAVHFAEASRKALCDAALQIVAATKYRSAGTCEFIVDEKGDFYFLEMNTRLQVEHPVTEAVTGVDLVCAQLDLAAGKFALSDLALPAKPFGHAIEVRVYAEDPAQGFIPCAGVVTDLVWPKGPGIRVDAGVEIGQTVHTLFDSMLAKIIVWAPTREHALARLRVALSETAIMGVGNNLLYLQALIENADVQKGKVYTRFLDVEFATWHPKMTEFEKQSAAALTDAARAGGPAAAGNAKATLPSPWSVS